MEQFKAEEEDILSSSTDAKPSQDNIKVDFSSFATQMCFSFLKNAFSFKLSLT